MISYCSSAGSKYLRCPESITCNYQKGICKYPEGWILYSGEAKRYFNGALRINFSEAGILNRRLICAYGYDYLNTHFFVLSSVLEVTTVNGIGWYWASAGFGKTYKSCNSYAGVDACSVLVRV